MGNMVGEVLEHWKELSNIIPAKLAVDVELSSHCPWPMNAEERKREVAQLAPQLMAAAAAALAKFAPVARKWLRAMELRLALHPSNEPPEVPDPGSVEGLQRFFGKDHPIPRLAAAYKEYNMYRAAYEKLPVASKLPRAQPGPHCKPALGQLQPPTVKLGPPKRGDKERGDKVAIEVEQTAMQWWELHAALYPNLSVIAIREQFKLATSIGSERSFSTMRARDHALRGAQGVEAFETETMLQCNKVPLASLVKLFSIDAAKAFRGSGGYSLQPKASLEASV